MTIIANEYEMKFETTKKAIKVAANINELVAYMKAQTQPQSVAEIGMGLYGKKNDRRTAAKIAADLRVLSPLVEVSEKDGEPIEVEHEKFCVAAQCAIKVYDDEGKTYEIPDPAIDPWDVKWEWRKVKKIITPKTKVYKWVG